jgi:FkbM family methyltransferase
MISRKIARLLSLARWYLFRMTHKRGFELYQLDGYKMFIDVGEFFTMFERLIGDFEPSKNNFIRSNLYEGVTFIDLGVNKGDYALLAASLVGPTGRVVAIEPEPENCSWIRRSIEANGFTNIELHEAAAADSEGVSRLFLGKKSGWHSLNQGAGTSGNTIDVKTIMLDNIGDGELIPQLIKIDVEGAEHQVLAGAAALVDRCRPIFVLDIHPHLGADIDAVEEFFWSRDYHAFALHDLENRLPAVPRVPMDLVFRPSEK